MRNLTDKRTNLSIAVHFLLMFFYSALARKLFKFYYREVYPFIMAQNGIAAEAFADHSLWLKYNGTAHDTLGKEITWFFARAQPGLKVTTTLLRCMYTTEATQAVAEGRISKRALQAVHNINCHSKAMAKKTYLVRSRAADIEHGRTVSGCLLERGRLSGSKLSQSALRLHDEDASEDDRPHKRVSRGHEGSPSAGGSRRSEPFTSTQLDGPRHHRRRDDHEDHSPSPGLSGGRHFGLSRYVAYDHTGEMDDEAEAEWDGEWDGGRDGNGDGDWGGDSGDLDSESEHNHERGLSSSKSSHRSLFKASWGSTRPVLSPPGMSSAGSLHPTEVGAKRQRWSPYEVRYVGAFCENVIKTTPARQTTMISECLKAIRLDPEASAHFHPKHIEKSNSLKTGWVRYSTLKANGELDAFLG